MKKGITVFLILSVIFSLFTGCSKKNNVADQNHKGTVQNTADNSNSDKVFFTTSLWSQPSQRQYIQNKIINKFEKKTNIPVRFEYIDSEVSLKRASLQQKIGKVNIDIVTIHSGRMPIWINKGYVEDLTPYIKDWKDIHFFPLFDKSAKKDGKTYFLPVVSDVYIMIANKKALKYLPKSADVNDLTWKQFVQWSHNIKKGEKIGKTVISAVPTNSFIYQFGAIELAYGAKFPDILTPGSLAAWNILLELKPDYVPNILNIAKPGDALQRGYGWLTFIHVADAGEVYNSDPNNFIIAPIPEGPAGRGSIGAGYGFGIIKDAKHKKDAIKLIKNMLSPKTQIKIARGSGGFIPPVKEALLYLGSSPKDEITKVGLEVFENATLSGVPSKDYYDWNAAKMIFDRLFKEMIIEKGTIDINMLRTARKELNSVMRPKRTT
jgi:multiple sugar transport system substrate-binding protein